MNNEENCSQSIACDVTISCFFQAFNKFLIYGMLVKDLDTSSVSYITSQGKRMQCHLAFTIDVNPITHKKINWYFMINDWSYIDLSCYVTSFLFVQQRWHLLRLSPPNPKPSLIHFCV